MRTQNNTNKLPFAARCVIGLFGLAGLAAVIGAIAYQPAFASGRIFLLLAVGALSARLKVNLYKGTTLSFLTAVVLFAVVKEGPAAAILIAICGVTIQSIRPERKLVLHQLVFNAGMVALTTAGTWWTHHMLTATNAVDAISVETLSTILASFTYFLGNSLSVSLIVAVTKGISLFHVWSQHIVYSAPSFMIGGLLSLGVIALINTGGLGVSASLTAVLAFVYYCSVRLTQQQAA